MSSQTHKKTFVDNDKNRFNYNHDSISIYNLFTRYYTSPVQWIDVAREAKKMDFNVIYLNPFQTTGSSNNLYSIKQYDNWDKFCLEGLSYSYGLKEIRTFLEECHKLGLKVIIDLVINHTAFEGEVFDNHPEWYKKDNNGNIERASYMTINGIAYWNDCAKLDYSDPGNGLWAYIEEVCKFYLNMGFDGFRCHVAANIPDYFWKYLVTNLRKEYSYVLFVGEAFLVSMERIKGLHKAGFDYVFNSSRWWDGKESWFIWQNNYFYENGIKTIAFPDNHSTQRVLSELNGNVDLMIQRLFLASILSSGFEITSGFEYGFINSCDVIHTRSKDLETTNLDFRRLIKFLNNFRNSYEVLHKEGLIYRINNNDPRINMLIKEYSYCNHSEKALIVLNYSSDSICISWNDLKHDFPICKSKKDIAINPFGFKIFVATSDERKITLKKLPISLDGNEKYLIEHNYVYPMNSDELKVKIEDYKV